jgi:hypothetical protein
MVAVTVYKYNQPATLCDDPVMSHANTSARDLA